MKMALDRIARADLTPSELLKVIPGSMLLMAYFKFPESMLMTFPKKRSFMKLLNYTNTSKVSLSLDS